MASQPHSEIVDVLCCTICTEPYDVNAHVPKILPCQHTLCGRCLTSLPSTASGMLACPMCRTIHNIPHRGFTINLLVLDIMESIFGTGVNLSHGLMCTVHEDVPCVLVCVDCAECLCTKCGLTDLRALRTHPHRNHRLVEPAEATPLLQQHLTKLAKIKQADLDKQLAQLENDPQAQGLRKAEAEVIRIKNDIVRMTENWADQQLASIRNLQKETTLMEQRIRSERRRLHALSVHKNSGIKRLIADISSIKTTDTAQKENEKRERRDQPKVRTSLPELRGRGRERPNFVRARNTGSLQNLRQPMPNKQYNFQLQYKALSTKLNSKLNKYKQEKTMTTFKKAKWKFIQRKRHRRSEISSQEIQYNKYVHDTEHGADVLVFRLREAIIVFDRKRKNVYCFWDESDDARLAVHILQKGPNITANGRFSHDIRAALDQIKPQFE